MTLSASIPGPKPAPVVGNVPDLDREAAVQSLMRLARTYGPIFRLELVGGEMIVVSSQALVNELCDERRFDKRVHTALEHIRDFAGDGLFTAYTQEDNWAKAHRILMPVFGPAALKSMFPKMVDIAQQLVLKWERQGPEQRIDIVDNTTRLTLDTIALCAFDYRFNSFYERDMHPFVGAMMRALVEAGDRGRRLPIQNLLLLRARRQYEEDIRFMHQIADQLIAERRRRGDPKDGQDILSVMLHAKDPVTGEGLSDENIRYQMVTFLIAGHETTSGLLSFAIYELLRHPEALRRAQAEADRVLGGQAPRFEHLQQLTYIGRPFALQEATLVLAMMLHRFDLRAADADDELEIKETLTMKPHGLFVHATRRATPLVVAASSVCVTRCYGSTTCSSARSSPTASWWPWTRRTRARSGTSRSPCPRA